MQISKVCILGGTGFVGRHLSARLAAIRVAGSVCLCPTRRNEVIDVSSQKTKSVIRSLLC